LTARVVRAIALVAAQGCATATATREPLVSDRPDFTESTVTMTPGDVQLEGGHTFERVTSYKVNTTGELLLRIGVTSRAELRIEPGSYTKVTSPFGDASGREDGGLGVKVRLHTPPDDKRSLVPALSLVLDSSIPTGSDRFRQNRPQPEAKLASAWSLTDRVDLSTNFNVARPRDENGRYTELAASASFGFELTPRVGAYAEVYGFAPQLEGAGRTHYANSGFTLSVTPNVQLDLRGGVGLNGDAPDYFVGAGIVRRW
jgi:hypothetical protein